MILILRCGPRNIPPATKAHMVTKKCGGKNLERHEDAVSARRLKIPAESLQDAEKEDDEEYCEESWQRFEMENNHVRRNARRKAR